MSNMITNGLSGLLAYQRAIDIASQNIANANTDGYVRQRVELSTQFGPLESNRGSVGGVKVDAIRREVNQYLIDQSRVANSGAGRAEVMAEQAQRIAALLDNPAMGLDDSLQSLKNAFEALSLEPASKRARDTLLSEIDSTIDRFKMLDLRLAQFGTEINGRLENELTEVNTLLAKVAQLNEQIFRAQISIGQSPTSVMDERDRLLDKLAESLSFRVEFASNQTVTVKSMDGRLLVKDGASATLSAAVGLYDLSESRVMLAAVGAGSAIDFTNGLVGGTLGGLVDARTQLTSATRNEAGRIVTALVMRLNAQQGLGRDLNGALGGSILAAGVPVVRTASSNSLGSTGVTLNVTLDTPPVNLTPSDFIVSRTAGGWQVAEADTGVIVSTSGDGSTGDPLTFAGMSVVVGGTGSATVGDSFLVQPTRPAIAGLERVITDPVLIAAARDALPFGAGDNLNVRAMSAAITEGYLDGGATSLVDAAARLSNRAGSQARSAQLTLDVQRLEAEETSRQRSNLHGVSLDEEAAKLLRFQQAYQASAAVIRVANELFDELLTVAR